MNQTKEKKKKKHQNLTAKRDSIFKAIMLDNPHILKAILETLLKREIKSMEILNSELPIEQFLEKGKRLDIYLKTEKEFIDIEASTSYDDSVQNRNLSYIFKVFYQVVKKGDNYYEYKKARSFNLVWKRKSDEYWEKVTMRNQHGKTVSDMVTYDIINMDKVLERYYNKDIEFIKENKYLIMLGLSYKKLPKLIKMIGGDKVVEDFAKVLERIVNDEDFGFISKEQDEQMLQEGRRLEALDKGRKEGRKEGREQGREQGMKNRRDYNIPISMDI